MRYYKKQVSMRTDFCEYENSFILKYKGKNLTIWIDSEEGYYAHWNGVVKFAQSENFDWGLDVNKWIFTMPFIKNRRERKKYLRKGGF